MRVGVKTWKSPAETIRKLIRESKNKWKGAHESQREQVNMAISCYVSFVPLSIQIQNALTVNVSPLLCLITRRSLSFCASVSSFQSLFPFPLPAIHLLQSSPSPLTSSDSPLLSGTGRNVWGSMFCSGRAGLDPLFCRTGNHINRPPVPFGWWEYCKCSWSQFVRWSRVSGLLLSSRLDRGKNITVFEFDVDCNESLSQMFLMWNFLQNEPKCCVF